MTEAARAAMNHDDDLIMAGNPQCRGSHGIEDAVVRHHLHFKVMVAGSQGAELVDAPPPCLIGDDTGVGRFDAAAFFDPVEVPMPAIALLHAPPRALPHDGLEI